MNERKKKGYCNSISLGFCPFKSCQGVHEDILT